MKRQRLTCILVAALVPLAVAQQGSYYDDKNSNDRSYYQRYDYGGRDDGYDDDLKINYHANQKTKKSLVGGWPRLIAASVGGFLVGSVVTSRKFKQRKGKDKNDVPTLRFKMNQRVQCNLGNQEWATGTIINLWYEQSPGTWMPYQIQLDNGKWVWAPQDNDNVIRAVWTNYYDRAPPFDR